MPEMNNFDPSQHQDFDGSYDPLPPGEYLVMIVASDIRENSNKNGSHLSLEYEVLDGPFKGHKVWGNLNLYHQGSATAKQIAERQLATICRAVGHFGVLKASEQIHDKPLVVKLKEKNGKNEIESWKAANGNTPAPAPAASSAPRGRAMAGAGAGGGNKPPWQR